MTAVKPRALGGMRLFLALGVLLADLRVSTGGIGYHVKIFSETFDPARVLALVVVLAAMAVFLNEVARRAEARPAHWKK